MARLRDIERSVTLMVSMITARPRIRAVLGVPMTDIEIETYIKFAVEMFLKGCGYTWPGMEKGG